LFFLGACKKAMLGYGRRLGAKGAQFSHALFLIYFGIVATALSAQSYQTNFNGENVDRSKSASTLHGAVEIDSASGSLDLKIPLGPGIGARGATFRPLLAGHQAP